MWLAHACVVSSSWRVGRCRTVTNGFGAVALWISYPGCCMLRASCSGGRLLRPSACRCACRDVLHAWISWGVTRSCLKKPVCGMLQDCGEGFLGAGAEVVTRVLCMLGASCLTALVVCSAFDVRPCVCRLRLVLAGTCVLCVVCKTVVLVKMCGQCMVLAPVEVHLQKGFG
jgi:hypothetical protein